MYFELGSYKAQQECHSFFYSAKKPKYFWIVSDSVVEVVNSIRTLALKWKEFRLLTIFNYTFHIVWCQVKHLKKTRFLYFFKQKSQIPTVVTLSCRMMLFRITLEGVERSTSTLAKCLEGEISSYLSSLLRLLLSLSLLIQVIFNFHQSFIYNWILVFLYPCPATLYTLTFIHNSKKRRMMLLDCQRDVSLQPILHRRSPQKLSSRTIFKVTANLKKVITWCPSTPRPRPPSDNHQRLERSMDPSSGTDLGRSTFLPD